MVSDLVAEGPGPGSGFRVSVSKSREVFRPGFRV